MTWDVIILSACFAWLALAFVATGIASMQARRDHEIEAAYQRGKRDAMASMTQELGDTLSGARSPKVVEFDGVTRREVAR